MRRLWIMVSIILAISCSEEPKEEPEPEPIILTESLSVCHCHRSAVSIYKALLIEERLEYKEAFWQLREECFTQWGALLFYPTECNDPDYLDLLADSLRNAGIDINSP
tara:strand:+ start:1091 stop:1414 length:324 start_codon:yes stop_codon:yes gene_type:complete